MNQHDILISSIADEIVHMVLEKNHSTIATELSSGIDWNLDIESNVSRIAANAINLSVRLSVQTTLSLLEELSILSLDPENSSKPVLRLVRGGLDSSHE